MALFDQKIATGPMNLDCVELQFDIDGHKLYRIKPDRDEMLRRYWLGVERQWIRLMMPLILRKVRNARTHRPERNS